MKLLLSLFACAIASASGAQNNSNFTQQLKKRIAELKNPQRFSVGLVRRDTTKQRLNSTFFLTTPQPGVHRLRQDHMPCIVPDPTATVSIPNAWRGEVKAPYTGNPPRIPNAAKPLIPSRPLLITPPDTK